MIWNFVPVVRMSNSKFKPRIEVVSGAKTGRRHWSDYEKLKIVQESLQDGVVQAQLARRHGVSPSQLYDWRYRYKAGLLVGATEFSQVVVVADDAEDTADQSSPTVSDQIQASRVGGMRSPRSFVEYALFQPEHNLIPAHKPWSERGVVGRSDWQ
ncbi:MAG: transposase, partial [Rhodobacterales bacterium]